MSQNLQNFVKFQKFQLENLVDFEKCKTHIFLQKSEPIQPKTSNILPKFCQPTHSDVSASELRPHDHVHRVAVAVPKLAIASSSTGRPFIAAKDGLCPRQSVIHAARELHGAVLVVGHAEVVHRPAVDEERRPVVLLHPGAKRPGRSIVDAAVP